MIEKKFNENYKIFLTDLGEKIQSNLLITLCNPSLIGLMVVFKSKKLTIKKLFDEYFGNTVSNYWFMEDCVQRLIDLDLIYLE